MTAQLLRVTIVLAALLTVTGCQPKATSAPTAEECGRLLAAKRTDKEAIANFIERARLDTLATGQGGQRDPLKGSLATCIDGLKLKMKVNQ